MTLLKNTILITLLFLFSFKLSKCQGNGFLGELAIVNEETPIEEVFPPDTQVDYAEEETREETTTTVEASWYDGENAVIEELPSGWYEGESSPVEHLETVVVDEQEQEDAGEEETAEAPLECPQYIEETEVDGYWMTFHPCCVSSKAWCDGTDEPVCIERVRCEGDHCRWHYETVVNVCNACKGHEDWHYSRGKCPWEESDKIW